VRLRVRQRSEARTPPAGRATSRGLQPTSSAGCVAGTFGIIARQLAPRCARPSGVVTKLVELAAFYRDNAIAMMCGPEVMLRFAALTLQARGVWSDRVYLAMERNMHGASGSAVTASSVRSSCAAMGPVLRYDEVEQWWRVPEL